MSWSQFPPPNRAFGSVRQAGEGREKMEQAYEQEAMLDRNDEGVAEVSRRSGVRNRLRSIFHRGDSSERSPESSVSDEEVWERERQHRPRT
jgi:hypothetical protein